MQKPILPIQISGASQAPARAKNSQPDGGAQFNQTLNREIEQRKAPPPPAPPAKQNGPAKPQQASTHDKAGAPKKTEAAPVRVAKEKSGKDGAVEDSAAAQAGAAAAATNPVVDMLALVASFNNLTSTVAPAAAAATEADPLLAGSGAPVVDAKFAAVAATAGLEQLAATGVALLEGATDGEAPIAMPAMFKDVMAGLDGAKRAAPAAADPLGQEKSLLGKDTAAANRPGEAVRGKDLPEPALFATVRGREVPGPDPVPKELQVAAPVSAPVQQASLALVNGANGVGAGDKIPARVGTPAWDNQVGQKIVWMVAGKEQSASLTLNPPDMGPMQVVLSVTNDHATVTFSSATPEVRQALEDAMPKLREMMSESGIALGNASVNDGAAQQQQQAQDQGNGRNGRAGATGPVENVASGSAAEAEAKAAARPARTGELPGLVDTFA